MPDPTWDLFNGNAQTFPTNGRDYSNVTEDGRTCVLLNVDSAYIVRTGISWSNDLTVEYVAKSTVDLNATATGEYSLATCYMRDSSKNELSGTPLRKQGGPYDSFGLFGRINSYPNTAGYLTHFSPDVANSTWHTMRIVVKALKIYQYIDGCFYGKINNAATPNSGYSANTIGIEAFASSGRTISSWVETIKISSTAKEPDPKGAIKIDDHSIATRKASIAFDSSWIATALRYQTPSKDSGNTTYGIELVDTTDTFASPVRISTSSGLKSLQKFPTF